MSERQEGINNIATTVLFRDLPGVFCTDPNNFCDVVDVDTKQGVFPGVYPYKLLYNYKLDEDWMVYNPEARAVEEYNKLVCQWQALIPELEKCPTGTHKSWNSCIPSKRTCTIANGTGEQTWNTTTNTWWACEVKVCNAGYTKVGNVCKKNENQFQCPQIPHLYVVNRTGHNPRISPYYISKGNLPTERKVRDEWIEKINKLKFISTEEESDEFLARIQYAGASRRAEDLYTRNVKYGLLPWDPDVEVLARRDNSFIDTVRSWNNLVCEWKALIPDLTKDK